MVSLNQPIRALILDLGGVTLEVNWHKSIEILNNPELSNTDAIVKALDGWEIYQKYEEGRISGDIFRQELNDKLNINLSSLNFISVWNACLPGELAGIGLLLSKVKIPIYALSNTNQEHYDFYINMPIFRRFKKVFTSHELHMRKPCPQIFAEVTRQIGVTPAEILYIDDLSENVRAAKYAGWNAEISINSVENTKKILQEYQIIH